MTVSKAKLAGYVQKAFDAFGSGADSIKVTLDYTYVTGGTYDPTTDTTADTTTTVSGVSAFSVGLKEQEVDYFPADINVRKLIINAADLTGPPGAKDYVTISGIVWQVKRITRVPGDLIYIVFVAEP